MSVGLFDGPAPRVFNMPPSAPFLDALARGVAAFAGGDPETLADVTILLPTRRATRRLADAFLRAAGESPPATILPAIRAIGDVEDDDAVFEPGPAALDAPPAIGTARRRFELAVLVHAKAAAMDPGADPAASLPLADALGRLLDEAAAAGGADMKAVAELYGLLPAHLEHAATFLAIVQKHWPKRLKELGCVEPAERRDVITRAVAEAWLESPPSGPIIAAGSTGTVPATAALLRAIARLPSGCVVLPGLDADLDAAAWDAVDEQHPQAGLRQLLQTLGVDREAVAAWPGADESTAARARRRLINDSLRPADATADWLQRVADLKANSGPDVLARARDGLALVEAATEEEEARVVALATREALASPDARVMVVTPDLAVSRRVHAAMARWGVDADLSSGRPLAQTALGAFLAGLLDLARDPADPVALCGLLDNSWTRLGRVRAETRAHAGDIDRALRGVRPGVDLAGFADAAGGLAAETLETLDESLSALVALAEGIASAADFARAHALVAEACASGPDTDGAPWCGAAGEAAAALLRELIDESETFAPLDLAGYARVFANLSSGRTVREPARDEARVRILGPLEARLQTADLVILAGLNEGMWPAKPPEDPFLSAPMREQAGLPPVIRRIGLSAHDFAQLACAPRVLMTRARKSSGDPAVASRWLWRVRTLLQGAGEDHSLAPDVDYAAIARRLDRVASEDVHPVAPPEPRPPIEVRPVKLSVSGVKEWVRDPYALYAKRILGLKRLDPLDMRPGPRERGTALHDALETLYRDIGESFPDDFEARLAALMIAELRQTGFAPEQLVFEEPRARRAAAWVRGWEDERRRRGWRMAAVETEGEWTSHGFTVTAKADRIDQGPDGWAILDYKTGQPPSAKQVRSGIEPQLSLEAAILAAGGFKQLGPREATRLVYVRVAGGRDPGSVRDLSEGKEAVPVSDMVDEAREGLARRVAAYRDLRTPYRSRVKPFRVSESGDHDRLARVKEWARLGDEEGA